MNHEERVKKHVEAVAITARGYSPIAMPAISGVGIIFAFYDGGSRVLIATGMASWAAVAISTIVGVAIAFLIEGMTIATMVTEDDTRQVSGSKEDDVLRKARGNKEGMFLATVASIAMLESGPALVSLWKGSTEIDLAVFRIGLIVFPFFSRIAASTFSVNQLLDVVLRDKRGHDEIKKAEANIELETAVRKKRALADLEIEAAVSEKQAKNSVKLAKIGGDTLSKKSVDASNLDRVELDATPAIDIRRLTKEESLDVLLDAFRQNPDLSYRDAGKIIGRSKDTVVNYLKELQAREDVVLNGHVEVVRR